MVDNEKSKSSVKKHSIGKRKETARKAEEEKGIELPISKILVALGVIIVLGLLLFFGTKYLGSSGTGQEKGLAAVVNGENITWAEINAKYDLVPATMKATITKETILNQTITEMVLRQEMDRRGITYSEKDVEYLLNDTKSQFMCEEQFSSTLLKNGWTLDSFRAQLALKLRLNKLIELDLPEMRLNETMMTTFFNANKDKLSAPELVRAEHILVNSSDIADEIIAKLNAGGDFRQLANEYSIDKASLICGGELGFFSRGMMIQEFEDAAFSLKVGELSKPVKTSYGYHIIKVLEKKPAKAANYNEMRPLIEMSIFNTLASANRQGINDYIIGLQAKAKIVYPKN
jgi:foldase protein PrsA